MVFPVPRVTPRGPWPPPVPSACRLSLVFQLFAVGFAVVVPTLRQVVALAADVDDAIVIGNPHPSTSELPAQADSIMVAASKINSLISVSRGAEETYCGAKGGRVNH